MIRPAQEPVRLPGRLRPGDRVGIVAPASPFDLDSFREGIAVIESMGVRTVLPDGLYHRKGYLAGSDRHRAGLLNSFFRDPAVRAVFCARGGFGSMKLLPHLDYPSIARDPKVFVGFSDISALLWALYRECRLATFHGPVVTSLKKAFPGARTSLWAAVGEGRPLRFSVPDGIPLCPGIASGIMAGGNLSTLCHLLGTPFSPTFDGHILFLEDRGERCYRIDRMLFQMKLSGCFRGMAGLILGGFTEGDPRDRVHRVVAELFRNQGIPVLAGLDAGHVPDNPTLPLGIPATLDAEGRCLQYHGAGTAGPLGGSA